MKGNLHTIDPNGDVLLVVEDCSDDDYDETKTKELEKQDPTLLTGSNGHASGAASAAPSYKTPKTEFSDSESVGNPLHRISDNATSLDDAILQIGGTKMRVSSKHLILTSKYFRTSLSSSWKEGQQLISKGFIVMRVTCSDPQALLILLNIIHCQNRKVPRSVDRKLLCEIAVLVDYYGFHEATEVFSEIWANNMECTISETAADDDIHIRELAEYILISIVFHNPDLFKKATRQAIRLSKDRMPCYGLPIPATLIEKIDMERQHAVSQVLQSIHKQMESFLENTGCCRKCDTWNLGEIIQRMHSLKLYPFPETPYDGVSFLYLLKELSSLRSECSEMFHPYLYLPHALIPETKELLLQIDTGISGLELETYKPLSPVSLP